MKSSPQVNVPLRLGGKKMKKRRELDALVAHSLAKRANRKTTAGNGINSQDQLLSPSTDDQEDMTWPKTTVRNPNRNHHRKFSFILLCAPLVFVTCISLSLGFMYWLYFDLRQQLYEYRQKIEEVTVTRQNLPEAIQVWHETSKKLEQNQTIIYGKIYELKYNLENLNQDFTQYKNKLMNDDKRKDYSKDEKFVAGFGAKIQAVTVDVENMKEKFGEFQKIQGQLNDDIKNLKSNFTNIMNEASTITSNKNTNFSYEIENVRNQILEKINSLTANTSTINNMMSQKFKELDEELIKHKKRLDELLDSSANTTSHVTSIEEDWAKLKAKFGQYENFKNEIKSQILGLQNLTNGLETSMHEIRTNYDKFTNDILKNMKRINEEVKQQETNSRLNITESDKNNNNNNEKNQTPKNENLNMQKNLGIQNESKNKHNNDVINSMNVANKSNNNGETIIKNIGQKIITNVITNAGNNSSGQDNQNNGNI